jgi:8-oxo-dGTP pyrophosphatase MutT (NUDIX family)
MNVRADHVTVFVARADESNASHEFLQLRRAADDYLGGTWQLIRGCIEPGETAVAASLREMREESGLMPTELYSLGPVETFYLWPTDTIVNSICFCALVDRSMPVITNHEHDAFRWTPRHDLDAQMMWASERRLFPDLCRDILDNGIAKPRLSVQL